MPLLRCAEPETESDGRRRRDSCWRRTARANWLRSWPGQSLVAVMTEEGGEARQRRGGREGQSVARQNLDVGSLEPNQGSSDRLLGRLPG